ncbi:hypothetical protein U1Q18_003473 [Sarracenia purpurea var. burkii]
MEGRCMLKRVAGFLVQGSGGGELLELVVEVGVGWEKCAVTGSKVWIWSLKKWRGQGVGRGWSGVGGWCNVTSGILLSGVVTVAGVKGQERGIASCDAILGFAKGESELGYIPIAGLALGFAAGRERRRTP